MGQPPRAQARCGSILELVGGKPVQCRYVNKVHTHHVHWDRNRSWTWHDSDPGVSTIDKRLVRAERPRIAHEDITPVVAPALPELKPDVDAERVLRELLAVLGPKERDEIARRMREARRVRKGLAPADEKVRGVILGAVARVR